jgi:hypothetical protein
VDYGVEFINTADVEQTPDVGYFPTNTGGRVEGPPTPTGPRRQPDAYEEDTDGFHPPTQAPSMVTPPPDHPPENDLEDLVDGVSSSPWRGLGFLGRASTPAREGPASGAGSPTAAPNEEPGGDNEEVPYWDQALPDTEDEEEAQPPPPGTSPGAQSPEPRTEKRVRFTPSSYPQRECRTPARWSYGQLGGPTQTRRPPTATADDEEQRSPTVSDVLGPESDEEDSNPDSTLTNFNSSSTTHTSDSEMNQMALLMMLCEDEWGPWHLRPGPIHKGV